MRTIVELNTFDYGSTGKICLGIKRVLTKCDVCTYVLSERWRRTKGREKSIRVGSAVGNFLSAKIERIGLKRNVFNTFNSLKIIRFLKKKKPDLVHIHNLHNNFLNLNMLFNYFKKSKTVLVWTLHDCWSFTGRCPHFLITNCKKWKSGCFKCPYPKKFYPKTWFDNSKRDWEEKKMLFNGIDNLTIVTPSRWLELLVKESFLNKYETRVIHNGIDLSIFKPSKSSIREKYNIPIKKRVVLGVSLVWSFSKGIDVFVELSKVLSDEYVIVLVGVDKKSIKNLPSNIISIERTESQKELAQLYSEADVFINPTREDNFPTVNLEALACGTPVITSDVGGCRETINESCGFLGDFSDLKNISKTIHYLSQNKSAFYDKCLDFSASFNMNDRFMDYYKLFVEKVG